MSISHTTSDWIATIRALTEDLVSVRGVSPSRDEIAVAARVHALLATPTEGPLPTARAGYAQLELLPIPGDPWDRLNVGAIVLGRSPRTVVLAGHFDTVGIADYGALAALATDPAALRDHLPEILGGAALPDVADWLFGRGVADMKSGIAIGIAIMRQLAARRLAGDPPPLTVVFIACADEETQSAGMLAAMPWLAGLRTASADLPALEYLGLINLDYVTARFPGDRAHMIYTGTVGKLLPLLYCVGVPTHAGDPFGGVDANLICADLVRALSLNPTLAERVGDETAAPPVTLTSRDLKTGYNTQTAHEAWLYLNVLTLRRGPDEVLARVTRIARRALSSTLAHIARRLRASQAHAAPLPAHLSGGRVWTFAALRQAAVARVGEAQVRRALASADALCPPTMDQREVTLQWLRALWEVSGERGPAVVLAFAPPYYPHVASAPGPFLRAIAMVAARYASAEVTLATYFPLLSDLSYTRPDPHVRLDALVENMPIWGAGSVGGRYAIPFDAIRRADIPAVANIGPYGFGAHQRGERVHMPYSFAIVPEMILAVLAELGATDPDT